MVDYPIQQRIKALEDKNYKMMNLIDNLLDQNEKQQSQIDNEIERRVQNQRELQAHKSELESAHKGFAEVEKDG